MTNSSSRRDCALGVGVIGVLFMLMLEVAAPAQAANDAEFKWYSNVPETMVVNSSASVGVRMRNIGTTTWTRAGKYKLAARCPNTWSLNRVYLSDTESVAPDTAKTFQFTITAPSVPGSYCFEWQMIDEDAPVGSRFFGERSVLKTILVTGVVPDLVPGPGYESQAIQELLDQGGRISLGPGEYEINTGLVLRKDGTVLTSASTSQRAILKATNNLVGPMLLAEGRSGFEISYVIFDGNKSARRGTTPVCAGYRKEGGNIRLLKGSSNFLIDHIDSNNTRCGSSLGIVGSGFEVRNSSFNGNGYPDRYGADTDPWSDGITLNTCAGGYVHDNHVTDSTDIGIVIGGGQNCRVENNVIEQKTVRAFAGLGVHSFVNDGKGDHTGSVFQGNTILAAPSTLDFGISVGFHPWSTAADRPTFGGRVVNNTVAGAVVNLVVDGYSDGEVTGNALSSPGGSFSHRYPSCSFSGNYTAADVERTTLQSGYTPMSFHSSTCTAEDDCSVNRLQKPWCLPDPDPVPNSDPSCSGTLDYRGDNCSDWKRYQCSATTDCGANNCTYNGGSCLWMCHWEPGGETCEDSCDPKALTPCSSRTTEASCNLGWGCTWG